MKLEKNDFVWWHWKAMNAELHIPAVVMSYDGGPRVTLKYLDKKADIVRQTSVARESVSPMRRLAP